MAAPVCTTTLVNSVRAYLTDGRLGETCTNPSIIKVNNDNLSKNGELYFAPSLKAWKCFLDGENTCEQNCTTIFQHFLHLRGGVKANQKTDVDAANEVFQLLVSASENWPISIERCCLREEKVCLYLSRTILIRNSIERAIHNQENYGRCQPLNKVFSFESYRDPESELTTARLNLIQNFTENVVRLHGCKVSEEYSHYKFVFTTKSEGWMEENCEKLVCGVVKNSQSRVKETSLTWAEHLENKTKEIEESNRHKYLESEKHSAREASLVKNIAKAAATFELLAVKPSRPVFVGRKADESATNTKGASFVLYNTARIAAINRKYNEKRSRKEYPDLPNIDAVDFSLLDQEEEWELVFNFILGYQETIRDCLKYDPAFGSNPQVLCLFLSRLCQKFSIYYRRIRILTEAYEHLIPTMVARLYMVQALWIVLKNALALLNIDPLHSM